VRPGNLEELSAAVGAATRAGHAVVESGGGMSYTGGYTPEGPDTVLIDMQRMKRVRDINRDDTYVVVECRCTWKSLFEALNPLGLRTPYWGPMSGMYATVGVALSQNSTH
jgi:D-lactate dehydrogenase (cytochrome)